MVITKDTSTYKFFAATVTTAAICTFALNASQAVPVPTGNYLKNLTGEQRITRRFNYEDPIDNQYYSLDGRVALIGEVKILHGFVLNLLNNSQDLDPKITEHINKNFWKLL